MSTTLTPRHALEIPASSCTVKDKATGLALGPGGADGLPAVQAQPVGHGAVAVGDDGAAVRGTLQPLRPHAALALQQRTHTSDVRMLLEMIV
jgi:hypothetical protein